MRFSLIGFLPALLLGLLLALASAVTASDMVEVPLSSPNDLLLLLERGLDVAYVSEDRVADVVLSSEEDRERLNGTGLHYSLLQSNLESYFAAQLGPDRDDMGGYYTLSEIQEEIAQLQEDFPELISETVIFGETIEGRDMWAVVISDNPNENEDEPRVLLTSAIHAREVGTVSLVMALTRLLLTSYGEDEYLTGLVDNREIWLIPCVNPDGYFENERANPDGGGMWRKNRRRNDDGTIGVDLNRNFGFAWGYDDYGSSGRPSSETYRGTGPFSEPETQAIRDLVEDHDFQCTMFFHSYGALCLYPWGYDFLQASDRALLRGLSERMVEGNGYVPGTGWEVIYLTNGESDDWIYGHDEENRTLAFTIETGTRQDNFWPPLNRMSEIIQELLPSCLALIEYSHLPERVLPPQPPENASYFIDPEEAVHLSWESPEEELNSAQTFDVLARLPGEGIIDDVPENDALWILDSFYLYNFLERSEPFCIRATIGDLIGTVTYHEQMAVPDTLWAWIRMRLTGNDNLALEVSEDRLSWTAVPGRETEEIEVEGYSHGPCISTYNTNNAYEHFWWDLREWSGRNMWLRFRYYHFFTAPANDNIYIDDIGPLPSFSESELVAEGLEEPIAIVENHSPADGWQFVVRSRDAEGDLSVWSTPAEETDAPPMMLLNLPQGWSMISAPYRLENLTMESIFAPLVERDILSLVKDAFGRFYAPRFGFNSLDDWDPLKGYQVNLDEACELLIEGERIPADTPIPLVPNWNLIAYLPNVPMPAEEALAGIIEQLELVKDEAGRFWSLRYEFNNLNDLRLGKGYMLRMNAAAELVYPQGEGQLQAASHPENPALIPPGAGSQNHSLLLRFPEANFTGRIEALDAEGFLSGVVVLESGANQAGLAVWGEVEAHQPGLAEGEDFRLFWRETESETREPLIISVLHGDPDWQVDGFSVLNVDLESAFPLDTYLLNAAPNPFNGRVNITCRLGHQSTGELHIFDLSGRLVFKKELRSPAKGTQYVTWDASNLPSGLYLARLATSEGVNQGSPFQTADLKLLLVK